MAAKPDVEYLIALPETAKLVVDMGGLGECKLYAISSADEFICSLKVVWLQDEPLLIKASRKAFQPYLDNPQLGWSIKDWEEFSVTLCNRIDASMDAYDEDKNHIVHLMSKEVLSWPAWGNSAMIYTEEQGDVACQQDLSKTLYGLAQLSYFVFDAAEKELRSAVDATKC